MLLPDRVLQVAVLFSQILLMLPRFLSVKAARAGVNLKFYNRVLGGKSVCGRIHPFKMCGVTPFHKLCDCVTNFIIAI